jgi:hypothetical protein
MSRSEADFHLVKRLARAGHSDYQIARITGVPRSTVLRWRQMPREPGAGRRSGKARGWRIADAPSYCYLLGCYLGDGYLTHRARNAWTLHVVCDRRYELIMAQITSAMSATFPGGRPTRRGSSNGASDVIAISHPGLGRAFPQHGAGRKHLRRIRLADWQLALTREHPGALIRGLIHSDGCRVVNRFKTRLPSGRVAEYAYVRYFFSNLSADIRHIFRDHCELLGIRVTQSNPRNLTVSHRDSVAILEAVVGPKS